jgi:hypothetical protein
MNINLLFHHILYSHSHFDSNKCKKRSNSQNKLAYIFKSISIFATLFRLLFPNVAVREVQEEESAAEEPPLIIYKQAPRPDTPPPLVIRERPPSPPPQPGEPLVIERRVARAPRHRQLVVEHLPPPPAKPRDIILEKWLPTPLPAQRAVYYQRLSTASTSCQYDLADCDGTAQKW